ncbi:MAG: AAA family ATPase [Candidatus Lambdaproteobacteria bacterium]|nr:AAA family ATPase [Candidatus Lambdaproteobacteria bacterium]
MDLFDHARERVLSEKAPLAARMRPRTLEEFVGQGRILGPGRLLRRAIQADQLSSLIFYGPPGTGKTTLAQIIAGSTRAHFTAINAVLAGVADIRAAVAEAQTRLAQFGRRTILFVDEVHRFNKAQQDALLPHVENGTVVLIGATTENPYFEVNKAIISRSRIFELKPLEPGELAAVLRQALADPERGYGKLRVELHDDALAHLADVANGDARAALNALELAVETTLPDEQGIVHITLPVAEESIQRKAVLYDKDGDAHFDAASAFIKSLRGSDADAALYWMARMLYAGEDPRFILRRMLIFAAEDVGLADPRAISVVAGAAQAFDYVGLPEGRFHLSEACLYLATAPKSNSTMGFFDALAAVERERVGEVPDHLKDANRDAEGLGHGQGYAYPHAYRDHWVAQQYLPDAMVGRVFYQPSEQGFESDLAETVAQRREVQLAALAEPAPEALELSAPGEIVAAGGVSGARGAAGREEWRRRSQGETAAHLQRLRARIFELATVQRHSLVLDAHAAGGLLLLEAARRATESGVWGRTDTPEQASLLREQAALLPRVVAPELLACPLEDFPALAQAAAGAPVRFDVILARNLLGRRADKPAAMALLAGLLAPAGRLVLAEVVPRAGGRVLSALDWPGLPAAQVARIRAAEEALYTDPHDVAVNWDEQAPAVWLAGAGLTVRRQELVVQRTAVTLTPETLAHWFGAPGQPSRLARALGDDANDVRQALARRGAGVTVPRHSVVVLLSAERIN